VPSDLDLSVAAKLQAAGQRYTPRRRALVDLLAGAGQPVTIPEILAADPSLAQSSAYRNLAVLEHARVVHRLVTNEGFARYELSEELTTHHHHLVCSSCGMVEDVEIPARLERSMERALSLIADDTGFSAVSHRLDLIGICRSCA
jgi:Fur family transcriptional regulator, ferric uptake regulator